MLKSKKFKYSFFFIITFLVSSFSFSSIFASDVVVFSGDNLKWSSIREKCLSDYDTSLCSAFPTLYSLNSFDNWYLGYSPTILGQESRDDVALRFCKIQGYNSLFNTLSDNDSSGRLYWALNISSFSVSSATTHRFVSISCFNDRDIFFDNLSYNVNYFGWDVSKSEYFPIFLTAFFSITLLSVLKFLFFFTLICFPLYFLYRFIKYQIF